MPSHIAGSWFPTGFHGHFRNKSRNDFVSEYRILAKPQPPEKFLRRSMVPRCNNVFSHHDNRHSFLNDAMIFEQGLGKKRINNSTYAFKQNFITWMPEKEYVERMRPLISTYHTDFTREQMLARRRQQQLVERPKTSFDETPTTTYRYSHCSGSPNQNIINAMNNEALKLSTYTRKQRAKSAAPKVRETVASCLSWYTAPHPPSTQRPYSSCNSQEPEASKPEPVPALDIELSPVSTNNTVAEVAVSSAESN